MRTFHHCLTVIVFQFCSLYGTVLVVLMAIDRYVSVKYPLEASSICTPKRSWIMATVTCGALIVYNIPYAIFSSVCYSISKN